MSDKVVLERAIFRPSQLAALDGCGFFKNKPPGPAAMRGTSIDSLLRKHYQGEDGAVPAEYWEGFAYAVKATDEIAGGKRIQTRKEHCKVEIPNFDQPGECDAIIHASLTSVDWKSGRLRSYKLQQAAYALGQMLTNWAPRWNAVVVFYDEHEVVWERFTLSEAQALIDEAREKYDSAEYPTINSYCAWCANFEICPAQREAAGFGLQVAEKAIDFGSILDDPQKLGRFLSACHTLEEYEKQARAKARDYLVQKTPVPGYILSNGRRTYSLPVETLVWLLSAQKNWSEAAKIAFEVFGAMTKKDYHELCLKLKIEPDDKLLKVSQGEPFVRAK